MDGRQPADRNQGGAEAGAAGAGFAERLKAPNIPSTSRGSLGAPLTRTLDDLAAIAAIRGDAAELAILSGAAAVVRAHSIESDSDLEPIVHQPGDLDDAVRQRLRQMYEAGAWVLFESALADLPADLRWLFESGAVTLNQVRRLHEALGVTSAADLAHAVDQQRIRSVPGFDAAAEYAVAGALFDLRKTVPRVTLGRATTLTEPLLQHLRSHAGVRWAEPVGSLRRGEVSIGDIEIVAAAADASVLIRELAAWPGVVRVLHRSDRRLYLLVDRVQIGIRFAPPETAGAALLTLTGSPEHIAALRRRARERGWQFDPGGLYENGSIVAGESEGEIYERLGLAFIPPEVRSGNDEIEAATTGALPRFVEQSDIRGDLHMHTSWSDGRDSVDAMVRACRDLGYEYMAITDHSPRAAASRTLTVDAVRKQADEIAVLRDRFPEIAILHGCEVDILADGRLDFPDRVLERFDIVLASLHEGAGHDARQLLERYTGALNHPLVNLITHPTNRVVPNRIGYDIDYDALFQRALDTGTLVEIDGSPAHLDLDGEMARRAAASGATLAISSDCHRADALRRQMRLGIVTARRGWIEPRHVLNTRPLADVRDFIARKRGS